MGNSAVLGYTVGEGTMLADAFARKLRAKYMAEARAIGRAEGEAKGLSAFGEAARRQGMDPEDIRRMIQEAREIARNGHP